MRTENSFVLLELSFEPPVNDAVTIKAAIQKKRQEWTRMQDIPGKRSTALYNLSLIPQIESIMLENTKRIREAKEAVKLRDLMLGEFEAELRILEAKGYITPAESNSLLAKYSAYGIKKEALHNLSRTPISASAQNGEEEFEGEVIDKITSRNIRRNLDLLGFENLYQFLDLPPYSSIKKLKEAIEEKRREGANKGNNPAKAVALSELTGICTGLFADFDSKQKYDRYIKISTYPAVGELIDEEFFRMKYISPAVMLRIVNFTVEKYGCKVIEAEDFVRRYCSAYGIPTEEPEDMVECISCGNKTEKTNERCPYCGILLKGNCPKCAAPYQPDHAVCTRCGFDIAAMPTANRYISEAENALIENNWSLAKRSIAYIKKYWPGHPQLESIEKRTKILEDRYSSYIENITDAVRHSQFYAAFEMIEEADARRIKLPPKLTEQVRGVIADLEKEIEVLKTDKTSMTYDRLHELTCEVSDSIELNRLLAHFPPQAPNSISLAIIHDTVRVDWTQSPSTGQIDYLLVRKAGSTPVSPYDGEKLYEGKSNHFTDKGLSPLTIYYYAVYALRGGTYSDSGALSSKIVLVPEIKGFRALPLDGGAKLKWEFNPHLREVLVWRKLGGEKPTSRGEGIQLESTRLDGFTDYKLRNDCEYWYYIVAVYVAGGEKIYSKGQCEGVVPHELVAPIDHINIQRINKEENEYIISWVADYQRDVLLFSSPVHPKDPPGTVCLVSDLMSGYRHLEMQMRTHNSALFTCDFVGGLYIFACSVSGKYATMGNPRYITNVRDVSVISYNLVGDDLSVNILWPENVDEVLFAWRFDRMPKTPGENGNLLKTITREDFEENPDIIIKKPEEKLYYFKLYSIYRNPDGTRSYSHGTELKADLTHKTEIFYTIKYSKPLFSSTYTVSLTFTSPYEITLPKSVIVGKIGRMPLKISDGMPLFEINTETKFSQQVTFEYKTSIFPKDLYIRYFLRDPALYEKYRILPLGDIKIT